MTRELVKDIRHFPVLCFSLILNCMQYLRSDLSLLINWWRSLVNKTEALQSGFWKVFIVVQVVLLFSAGVLRFASPIRPALPVQSLRTGLSCTWVYSRRGLAQIEVLPFLPGGCHSCQCGAGWSAAPESHRILSVLGSIFPVLLALSIRSVVPPSRPPVTGALQKCGCSQPTVPLL